MRKGFVIGLAFLLTIGIGATIPTGSVRAHEQDTTPAHFGMTGNYSECPGAMYSVDTHSTNATWATKRGGGYGWLQAGYAGVQSIATRWFLNDAQNASPTPAQSDPYTMPGAWHDWPTQDLPYPYGLDNATIRNVYVVSVVNPVIARTVHLSYSLDNGANWVDGASTYLTGSDWMFFYWNVTGDRNWTVTDFTHSSTMTKIESDTLAYWPFNVDYVGLAYNWTLPGTPGPPPPSGEPDFNNTSDMFLFAFGMTGVVILVASPAVAIWYGREHDKINAFLLWLIMATVGLGFFLAGAGG